MSLVILRSHIVPLRAFLLLLTFFFFNDTATTEIYTLSLHDALPICQRGGADCRASQQADGDAGRVRRGQGQGEDRKSTRLNSSHVKISYAVFCLKKKKKHQQQTQHRG